MCQSRGLELPEDLEEAYSEQTCRLPSGAVNSPLLVLGDDLQLQSSMSDA